MNARTESTAVEFTENIDSKTIFNDNSIKASNLMSDFDVYTKICGYSIQEAEDMVSRMKIQKLNDLKLQILAQNPYFGAGGISLSQIENRINGLLVFHINIGSLPSEKAEAFMEKAKCSYTGDGQLETLLKKKGYKSLFISTRDQCNSVYSVDLKDGPGVLTFYINVGTLSPDNATKRCEELRQSLNDQDNLLDCIKSQGNVVLFIPVRDRETSVEFVSL